LTRPAEGSPRLLLREAAVLKGASACDGFVARGALVEDHFIVVP
jgi:hypothetical protein